MRVDCIFGIERYTRRARFDAAPVASPAAPGRQAAATAACASRLRRAQSLYPTALAAALGNRPPPGCRHAMGIGPLGAAVVRPRLRGALSGPDRHRAAGRRVDARPGAAARTDPPRLDRDAAGHDPLGDGLLRVAPGSDRQLLAPRDLLPALRPTPAL